MIAAALVAFIAAFLGVIAGTLLSLRMVAILLGVDKTNQ